MSEGKLTKDDFIWLMVGIGGLIIIIFSWNDIRELRTVSIICFVAMLVFIGKSQEKKEKDE